MFSHHLGFAVKSNPGGLRWLLPPIGKMKLNCDGASKGNPGLSAGGGAIRNHCGQILAAYAYHYGFCSSFEAEFRAVIDGFRLCEALRIKPDLVEWDSSALVALLSTRRQPPWYSIGGVTAHFH